MSALLPCPFCGGEARLRTTETRSFFWGKCRSTDCLAEGPPLMSEAFAIAAWNQRATPAEVAALRAEVERLRGALSPLVAVIPDICNALDLDPDETSIRVRVDGGARDGEVLAERTLADMLTVARAALAKGPGDEG